MENKSREDGHPPNVIFPVKAKDIMFTDIVIMISDADEAAAIMNMNVDVTRSTSITAAKLKT